MAMADDYSTRLQDILIGINEGKIVEKEQNGPFTYCSTFRPIDGFINWKENTDTILRWFYVFGAPLGTGLKFILKNKTYSITKISRINSFAPAVGIAGSVVYKVGGSIWVKTGDTAVSIDGITLNDEVVDLKKVFNIGQRLQ